MTGAERRSRRKKGSLAATLAVFPSIPITGLTLLIGVDRFMAEARSITNLIGNGVATVVIASRDGALDIDRVRRVLDGIPDVAQELDADIALPSEDIVRPQQVVG